MPKEYKLLVNAMREEDKKAYRLVVEAGMDCEVLSTFSEEGKTPVLYWGYVEMEGLGEIEEYVEAWKTHNKKEKTDNEA